MAAGLNNNAKNAMLNQLTSLAVFVSAHTADPGATGTSEVTGGSPAYARKAITWNAASSGSATASNTPVFDIPASTTVAFVGLWSAATSGTFYGSADVVDEVFAGQGTYTVTSFTLTLT